MRSYLTPCGLAALQLSIPVKTAAIKRALPGFAVKVAKPGQCATSRATSVGGQRSSAEDHSWRCRPARRLLALFGHPTCGHDPNGPLGPLMTQSGQPNSRRNAALRLTLTLFDVGSTAESLWAQSAPAYGRFGAGKEAARAVSVLGALASRRASAPGMTGSLIQ